MFLKLGSHYYRTAPVDMRALDILEYIDDCSKVEKGTSEDLDYMVLSSLPKGIINKEHLADKIYWLERNAPYASDKLIPCFEEKYSLIKRLGYVNDGIKNILIDDFNPNLLDWESRGGISVKYLNGVNTSSSWGGYKISNTEDLKKVLEGLKQRYK